MEYWLKSSNNLDSITTHSVTFKRYSGCRRCYLVESRLNPLLTDSFRKSVIYFPIVSKRSLGPTGKPSNNFCHSCTTAWYLIISSSSFSFGVPLAAFWIFFYNENWLTVFWPNVVLPIFILFYVSSLLDYLTLQPTEGFWIDGFRVLERFVFHTG